MRCLSPLLALALSLGVTTGSAWASADDAGVPREIQQLVDSLRFREGTVRLQDGDVALHLPTGYRFLGSQDAALVLEKLWDNPPSPEVLGMVFPPGTGPIDDVSWAVVVTYEDSGYVSSEDAKSINYDEILQQMKSDAKQENEERAAAGYEPVEVVGWAESPHYDAGAAKIFWAQDLRFGEADDHTLNYSVRILGREGVLKLNAVSGLNQLGLVRQTMPALIQTTEFTQGKRYQDFNQATDRLAGYGLTALVLGGAAAKSGVGKGLIALLLGAKKFILALLIGAGAFVQRIFGKKNAA